MRTALTGELPAASKHTQNGANNPLTNVTSLG